jgi:hypothetical protein
MTRSFPKVRVVGFASHLPRHARLTVGTDKPPQGANLSGVQVSQVARVPRLSLGSLPRGKLESGRLPPSPPEWLLGKLLDHDPAPPSRCAEVLPGRIVGTRARNKWRSPPACASLQRRDLILPRSLRLARKAIPAPRIGRGPGTGCCRTELLTVSSPPGAFQVLSTVEETTPKG